MRRLTSRVAGSARAGSARLRGAQGAVGVLALAGGAYLLTDRPGSALVVLGVFMLLGAWADR